MLVARVLSEDKALYHLVRAKPQLLQQQQQPVIKHHARNHKSRGTTAAFSWKWNLTFSCRAWQAYSSSVASCANRTGRGVDVLCFCAITRVPGTTKTETGLKMPLRPFGTGVASFTNRQTAMELLCRTHDGTASFEHIKLLIVLFLGYRPQKSRR